MRARTAFVASSAAIVAMLAVSAWAWTRLSDGAVVPTHWDLAGRPNGYSSKELALFLLPVIATVVVLVFAVIPRVDPRGPNLLLSRRAYSAILLVMVAFFVALHALLLTADLSDGRLNANMLLALLGALFVVIGNYLGKVRSNFFIGVRTPWTLSSELSWNRTNRLGGRVMLVTGVGIVTLALVGLFQATWVLMVAFFASIPGLVVYSFFAWRDDPSRGHGTPTKPYAKVLAGALAGLVIVVAAGAAALTFVGGKTLDGSARAAVLAYSEPATDNLMAGYNALVLLGRRARLRPSYAEGPGQGQLAECNRPTTEPVRLIRLAPD